MPTYQEWLADQNRQRSAAQGRLSGAQSNLLNAQSNDRRASQAPMQRRLDGTLGSIDSSDRDAALSQLNQASSALGGIQSDINRFDPLSPENRAEGNRLQAYDLARGGVDRLANDPTDQFIRQALQTAAGPDGGPFNSTTRNAMFTNAMESSGQDAQVQSIMDSAAQRGLTANDPTVQAALRRAQGEQAQAGQRARLGIDLQANPANYAAQQSAVNRLGDYNSGRQQQQQSAEDRLREMLWNEGINQGTGGAQVAQVNLGGGGGYPAPAPAPQPQPYQPAPVGVAPRATTTAANRAPGNAAPGTSGTPLHQPTANWTATNLRTGQQMTGQNGEIRTPVNTGTTFGPQLRSPVNEPITARNLIPTWGKKK